MATIDQSSLVCGPGNIASVPCDGFDGGPATISVSGQTVAAVLGQPTTGAMLLPATFGYSADGTTTVFSFTVPDGLQSGVATVTDLSGNIATFGLAVASQYAQQSDYTGEGADLDPLFPTGPELDVILRRASAYVDSFIGGTVRQLTWLERHRFRKSRRIYPYHRPVVSIDSLTFVTSNTTRTVFAPSDLFIDPDLNYVEMLAYGFGNYALLGAFETVGYSANVLEVTLTAGYPAAQTPDAVREATVMIASSLIDVRRKRALGLGGMKQLDKDSLVSDGQPFAIPQDVKAMLRPFIVRSLR